MYIPELSEHIIIDEIRQNPAHGDIYFLSHLLGNEMLTLPESWSSRIYTSQFIFEILTKKTPSISLRFFKLVRPNVPVKLKSTNKTIMVTMFEIDSTPNNVMFFFDDSFRTFLYTGISSEPANVYSNELLMSYIHNGIDYLYVDTTRCHDRLYRYPEDTIREIKEICNSHSNSAIAIIMPTFGYEKLLIELVKAFPDNVYPNAIQKRILLKLGYDNLVSISWNAKVSILPPGTLPDVINSSKVVAVYIAEGVVSEKPGAFGIYVRHWSPLPSLMDIQTICDIVRPKNIAPIKQDSIDKYTRLPACLKWFTKSADHASSILKYEDSMIQSTSDTSSVHTNEGDRASTCSNPIGSPTVMSDHRSKKDINSSKTQTLGNVSPIVNSSDPKPKYIRIRSNGFEFDSDEEIA